MKANFMLKTCPTYASLLMATPEPLNQALLAGYLSHADNAQSRRSHFYQGRYENIYIGTDQIPELSVILQQACSAAAQLLHLDAAQLRAGLWFNAMPPGSRTLKHAHDDDDELLSAVYYVQVPENSGELILYAGAFTTQVKPQAGMLVLFPPDVPHEVTENKSSEMRLSLGINIGPLPNDAD